MVKYTKMLIWMHFRHVILLCIIREVLSASYNRPGGGAILISQYAKVSHAGINQGRSSGQTYWTQRTNADVSSYQNTTSSDLSRYDYSKKIKTIDENTYHPAYVNGYSTIDESQLLNDESEGVVDEIDRYNPRPYFGYGADESKSPLKTYGPPEFDLVVKPPDSSPVFDSGANNPSPDKMPNTSGDGDNSDKMTNFADSSSISYTPPPNYKPGLGEEVDSYASALDSLHIPSPMMDLEMDGKRPIVDSYKPPASGVMKGDMPPDFDGYVYPPNDKPTEPLESPNRPSNTEYQSKPPAKPPTSKKPEMKPIFHDYPPHSFDQDAILDHYPMPDEKPMMPDPGSDPKKLSRKPTKVPEYLDYNPEEHGGYHGGKGSKIIDYLDDHFHHQHVYQEVTTKPSTLKMEEDERVNKRPYSYYYLGRKLWYIPLYFSLYFIVYIFALIVKSIIRHKVHFPNEHNWQDFKSNRRAGRQLNKEIVNTATETVVMALEKAAHRYRM